MTRSRLVNPWNALTFWGKILFWLVIFAVLLLAACIVYCEARMQGDVAELDIAVGSLQARVDGIEEFLYAATRDGFWYVRVPCGDSVTVILYPDSTVGYEIGE